ncbi:MAG TPA: dicarboxylate transporter/tellurite-resistance protein TehA [Burkholderiales bacterium]|nr:dicarboxylate transporter/tellurite-resistance protein TehA [Burkholderiales bacterium]
MPSPRLASLPASFFGVVLGVGGLGFAWRHAHLLWGLPAWVGEALLAIASMTWTILIVLFVAKWVVAREAARIELGHPVQCCFIGLIGVTTMLVAQAALPYSYSTAAVLFGGGASFTLVFALWRTSQLWHGERDIGATTAVLYLPFVAGSFVTATVCSSLGFPDWGQLAFGGGLFAWLAIESVLLHRLYTGPSLPPPMRPTLGIQMAPPVVGAVAYLSITGGPPDVFVHAMLGYGIFQALLMLFLLPWIRQQPFSMGYWAFSFGATAIAIAPLIMAERGEQGAVRILAAILFAASNIVIAFLFLGTLRLALRGQILPPAATQPAPVKNESPAIRA